MKRNLMTTWIVVALAVSSFGDLQDKPGEDVHEGRRFKWGDEKMTVSGEGYLLSSVIMNNLQMAGGGELDFGETLFEIGGDLTYNLSESQKCGFTIRDILPRSAVVDNLEFNNRLRVQGYLDSPELWRLGGYWTWKTKGGKMRAFMGRDRFVDLPMERFSQYYGTYPLSLKQAEVYDQGAGLSYVLDKNLAGFSVFGIQGDREFGMPDIRDDGRHNSYPSWIFEGTLTPTVLLGEEFRDTYGDFLIQGDLEWGQKGSNPGSKGDKAFSLLTFLYKRHALEVWGSFGQFHRGLTEDPRGRETSQGWATGACLKGVLSSPIDVFIETSSTKKKSGPSVELWRGDSTQQDMSSIGLRWNNVVSRKNMRLNFKASYTSATLENPESWSVLQKRSDIFLFELEAFFK